MLKKVVVSSLCVTALWACKPEVATVEVAPATVTMGAAGEAKDLKAIAKDKEGKELQGVPFTWKSSADAVATVAADGKVTAKADGDAVITATTGEKSGTAKVAVIIPARVEVVPPSLNLKVGDAPAALKARVLTAKGVEVAGRKISWATDKDTIAKVGPDGMVTPVAVGTATITATSDKLNGTATVVVIEAAPPAEEAAPPAEAKKGKKGKK